MSVESAGEGHSLEEPPRGQEPGIEDQAGGSSSGEIISHRRLPGWLPDAIIVLLIFLAGNWVGSTDVTQWSTIGPFWEATYAPAIMLACGHGLVDTNSASIVSVTVVTGTYMETNAPAMTDFLTRKSDRFSCAQIPGGLRSQAMYPFQKMQTYLMSLVAFAWFLGGISWSGLAWIFGLLYSATAVSAYGLFRLGMNRVLALAGTLLIMFSVVNLGMLNQLRDYSKAPFILGCIFIMGLLVSRQMSMLRLTLLAGVAGVIAGLGIGFRVDVLIVVPAFLVGVLFFLPRPLRAPRRSAGSRRIGGVPSGSPDAGGTSRPKGYYSVLDMIRSRLLAAGAFLVTFGIVGWPILTGLGGGNTFLGFTTPFTDALDVQNAQYEWGYLYYDTQEEAVINSYSYCSSGNTNILSTLTPEYDQVSSAYFLNIVRNFPADMVTRGYASVLGILQLPFNGLANSLYLDPLNSDRRVLGLKDQGTINAYLSYEQQFGIEYFAPASILLCVLALLLLSRWSLRVGFFALFVLLYFCGYTALQYSTRHYFHLETLGLWGIGFVGQQLIDFGWRIRLRRTAHVEAKSEVLSISTQLKSWWSPSTRRMVLFALAAIVALAGVLYVLRLYQQQNLDALLQRYTTAELEPLQVQDNPSPNGSGRVLITPMHFPTFVPQASRPTQPMIHDEYLVLDLKEQQTDLPIFFLYSPTNPTDIHWNHTRRVDIKGPFSSRGPGPDDTTQIIVPIYAGPNTTFTGIDIAKDQLSAVKGIYRISDSCQFPLLLWLTLRPDWRSENHYQTLTQLEDQSTYVWPPDASTSEAFGPFSSKSLQPAPMIFHNDIVKVDNSRLSVSGVITNGNQALVQFKEQQLNKGDYFVAQGFLYWGCIDFTMYDHLTATGHIIPMIVKEPGPFKVALQVPESGMYTLSLRDSYCHGQNSFRIDEAAWRH